MNVRNFLKDSRFFTEAKKILYTKSINMSLNFTRFSKYTAIVMISTEFFCMRLMGTKSILMYKRTYILIFRTTRIYLGLTSF